MKKIALGTSDLMVSTIGLGCMTMAGLSAKEATAVVDNALDLGINFLIMLTFTVVVNLRKSFLKRLI